MHINSGSPASGLRIRSMLEKFCLIIMTFLRTNQREEEYVYHTRFESIDIRFFRKLPSLSRMSMMMKGEIIAVEIIRSNED